MHVALLFFSGPGFPHVARSSPPAGNQTDRLALLEFKAAITSTGPFGNFNSWNESVHFWLWIGVTCGRQHRRVTILNLDHHNLIGHIPPHIGNLSFLRELWLRNNSLSQNIPSELSLAKAANPVSSK
ncbi:hypothetical protein RHMOL_Rhmol06G0172900 [Rhododendron molle]|uniref:Uncharacterized protein n=1 Tax=Rhododendron molle TaxID=49168 RepID=A0ACC0NDI8_RHOML|nr:hypothetical protein RHMOL_Rhmol06G0172900 [Rhododendron molle]